MATQRAARKDEVDLVRDNVDSVQKLFEDKRDSLLTVMPDEMRSDVERITKLCIRKYASDRRLAECTPSSFFSAIIDAVQVGLDPSSPHGLCWFVPRRNRHNRNRKECNFQIGYKGFAYLARRYGLVKRLVADVVVEGETFHADRATGAISHPFTPGIERSDPSKYVCAYACATLPDDSIVFEIMTPDQIAAVRAKAMSDDMWTAWPDRMWRKSAIIRLLNGGQIDLTPQFAQMFADDVEREFGDDKASPEPIIKADVIPRTGVDGLLDRLTDEPPTPGAAEEPQFEESQ